MLSTCPGHSQKQSMNPWLFQLNQTVYIICNINKWGAFVSEMVDAHEAFRRLRSLRADAVDVCLSGLSWGG